MSAESEKVKGALAAFVNRLLAPTRYYAKYPSRVVKQNSDGTLELIPDDSRIPGLSRVPIRYGVPGVIATVRPGSRVRLGFAAGDPQQPEAELWEPSSVVRLQVAADSIEIGSDGVLQPAALGQAVRVELDAIWLALQTHVHSGGTLSGSTGPATVAPVKMSMLSATVKVKE